MIPLIANWTFINVAFDLYPLFETNIMEHMATEQLSNQVTHIIVLQTERTIVLPIYH